MRKLKATVPLHELQPRRICLIRPSALGDVVQAIPALTMLRQRFPSAHIAWVVKSSFAGLLTGHPDLDEVIELPYPPGRLSRVWHFYQTLRRIRRSQFDLVIDLHGLFRSALMTLASGAPRRVGLTTAREGAPWTYTDRLDIPWKQVPSLEMNRRVAESLGCTGPSPRTTLPVRDEDRLFALRHLNGLPRPLLAIHPGAAWETKRWPPQNFLTLAKRASEEFGAGIVLVGGGGEKQACDWIASRFDDAHVNLAGRTSLLELAAVAGSADVFLSGDTGPMHLAAAMETPVVVIFTCTSPLRAGPRVSACGTKHEVVQTTVACAESYLKKCRSLICMREVTPDRVWPALKRQLHAALQCPVRRAE